MATYYSDKESNYVGIKKTGVPVTIPWHYVARYNYFVHCNFHTDAHKSGWRPKYFPIKSIFYKYGTTYYNACPWTIYVIFELLSFLYLIFCNIPTLRAYLPKDFSLFFRILFYSDVGILFFLQTWMMVVIFINCANRSKITWAYIPVASYMMERTNQFLTVTVEKFNQLSVASVDIERNAGLLASVTSGYGASIKIMCYTHEWWMRYYQAAIWYAIFFWLFYMAMLGLRLNYEFHIFTKLNL